jgi:hypothetical protein
MENLAVRCREFYMTATTPHAACSKTPETTILAVRERSDGYWYIGAGRSIAEGPYRYPQQLLAVACDLLASDPHWRIEVFDVGGSQIISYSSEQYSIRDLDLSPAGRQWLRPRVMAAPQP